MTLLLEHLESRLVPGGLFGSPDDAAKTLLLDAASGQIAIGRRAPWVPIDVPKADLVLIPTTRDGKPDRFLDAAHDVWPPNVPLNVSSVQSVIDNIQTKFNETGKPVSVILVGSGLGSQLIVGKSYFMPADNTDPGNSTPQFIAACQGQVASITVLVGNGTAKAPIWQSWADGLSVDTTATVSAYSGPMAVGGVPMSFQIIAGNGIHIYQGR